MIALAFVFPPLALLSLTILYCKNILTFGYSITTQLISKEQQIFIASYATHPTPCDLWQRSHSTNLDKCFAYCQTNSWVEKKKKKLKSVSKTKDCVFGGNERWVTEGKTQIAAQFMDKPHMQTGLLVFHLQPVAVGYRWRSHSCTIFRWHHNI